MQGRKAHIKAGKRSSEGLVKVLYDGLNLAIKGVNSLIMATNCRNIEGRHIA